MLLFIQGLHARLYLAVLVYFAALGAWSLVKAARDGALTQRFLNALLVGQLALMLQGMLGVVVLLGGLQPARLGLHLLYGVAVILALPLAGLYGHSQSPRERHAFVALICLAICVLAWRAQVAALPFSPP